MELKARSTLRALRFFVLCRRNPSAILLAVQLAGMLLVPVLDRTALGRLAFAAVGAVILFVTIRLVRVTPFLTWVSVAFAVPAIVLQVAMAWQPQPELMPWSAGLEAVFYFYAAGSLIAYTLDDRRVTTDELFAAAATFTLIAWGFTYLYLCVQAAHPGSFAAAVDPGDPRSWTELMYLSFALLSSTGIGDVIPLTPVARSLAAIEMLVGVLYLATVVSRLIGLSLAARADAADPAERR